MTFRSLKFGCLIFVCLLLLSAWSLANAMGSAPKKEEPKYKLEITNIGVTPIGTVQQRTLEAVSTSEGSKKYKLEIYKIEMVPGGKK